MPEVTITTPTKDSWLDENDPNDKKGGNTTFVCGRLGVDGSQQNPIVQFDLSVIPPGSQIITASMFVYQSGVSAQFPIRGARILSGNSDWSEANCTWNDKDAPTDWEGAVGCTQVGVDIASGLIIDCNLPNLINQYIEIPMDATETQALLDVYNYGFTIWAFPRGLVGVMRASTWHARESNNDPYLIISYVEPSRRLVTYHLNVWDAKGTIKDSQGRVVPPDEVLPDNWIRLIGAGKGTSKVYDDLVADPLVSYIETVSYRHDENRAKIRASKESMLRSFLKRLGGVAG